MERIIFLLQKLLQGVLSHACVDLLLLDLLSRQVKGKVLSVEKIYVRLQEKEHDEATDDREDLE